MSSKNVTALKPPNWSWFEFERRVGLPALANWYDYEVNWRRGVFQVGIPYE
jgi:hypothetical protein